MTRLFARGELKLALLEALSSTGPAHGYAVMQALREQVGGGWQPSPGAVYPALLSLEDADLVVSREEGSLRVYELTGAGRSALDQAGRPLARVAGRARASEAAGPTLGDVVDAFARDVPGRTRRLSRQRKAEVEHALTATRHALAALLDDDDRS